MLDIVIVFSICERNGFLRRNVLAAASQSQFKFGSLTLVGAVTIVTLSVLYIPIHADITTQRETTQVASDNDQVVVLTNLIRTQHGLNPLRTNNALQSAALAYASDMATRGYFSHNTPEGKTALSWITEAGYTNVGQWAENIAAGYASPEENVTLWQNSPEDLNNILNANFADTGVGISRDLTTKKWLYVQLFSATHTDASLSPNNIPETVTNP